HTLIDGDLPCRVEEPRDFGGMGLSHVVCGGDVCSRHDQHVHGSLGMNVAKRDDPFILVEKVGVHLALDDATEQTRVVHKKTLPRTCWPKTLTLAPAWKRVNSGRSHR